MGSERVEEHGEDRELLLRDLAGGVDRIYQSHQGGYRGVELDVFDIAADLLDGAVELLLELGADDVLAGHELLHIPEALDELAAAAHGVGAPGCSLLKVADEHLVHTQGVGAVLFDDLVGVDDVAARFAHLLAVGAEDHAVGCALCIRLLGRDDADIIQELVPEAAVQQMEGGVLHAAVVPVYLMPVIESLF